MAAPLHPRLTPGRLRGFLIVLALMLGYEGYAFFLKEAGESANLASPSDRHLTGEVAGEAILEQGITPHANGFDGLDIWAHATSDVPPGPMRVTMIDDTRGLAERVASVSYPAAEVIAQRPFHVIFPRVDASAGGRYIFQIAVPEASAGHGLRFEASGPTYVEGTLRLGGREEWGDLQFRTTAERTTIYRNVRHLRQSSSVPAFARTDLFLAVMLLLFNLALAALLYDLVFAGDVVFAGPDRLGRQLPDQPQPQISSANRR